MKKPQAARLLSLPEDYAKVGVKQGIVEPWEDGKRDDDRAGAYEWWYFDMILDDGSKAVIHFNTKALKNIRQNGCAPSVVIKITLPDGTDYKDDLIYPVSEAVFGKDKCDVKYGPHSITGDLKEYVIKVEPVNGVGANLKLTNLGKPWRPGAGNYEFNNNKSGYFTWLCVVPKGKVEGTITVDGKERQVTGFGYHDHQWGNMSHLFTWNHWLWSRQSFDDYTILVFDIVTNAKYGHKRFPMMFLQDKDGNVICEDLNAPKTEVIEEYVEKLSQKKYPKVKKYTFENDGKKVEYTLSVVNELESRDAFTMAPKIAQLLFKIKKVHPSTARYYAKGDMKIIDGNQIIERSGNLIYEFVYMSSSYREFVEN